MTDFARAPHNAQTKLKSILTPIWSKEMGARLRIARERMLRSQKELAAVLSTPQAPICPQTIAAIECGRRQRSQLTWARLEAVLGTHTAYVLIARDQALYNVEEIGNRYFDYRQRAMRRRNGLDPKKGETPPWPRTYSSRSFPSRKRGSVR